MRTDSAAILRSAFSDSIRLGTLEAFLSSLSGGELQRLHYDFELWARDDQLPPAFAAGGGPWTTWLMLGGRGAGKTRAGAEWVRAIVSGLDPSAPAMRVALVGETLADARAVMVEGVSGLLAVHPPHAKPLYEPSKRQITWPNGAIAQVFSADDPESLRGPQFSAAWCDELCKWRRPDETWDMLQFGLRLGAAPRQVVTTTPRPTKLLKALLADPLTAVTRVSTAANEANLAPGFLDAIVGRYRVRRGRQEQDGTPMALVMTAAPAVEPIGLAEAKAHLRIDASDEDSLLTSLITAGRMFVERTLSLALITESWSLYLDGWPRSGTIALPIQPVQAVTAVKVYDPDDSPTIVNSETYSVDVLSEPARLVLSAGAVQLSPARLLNAFEVAFTAGFGDEATNVPAPIRHALKLLVAHWFEHREPVVLGELPQEVPATVAGLLLPYRRVRL